MEVLEMSREERLAHYRPVMKESLEFPLGSRVRDVVSGAEGTALMITAHINGCIRLSVILDAKPDSQSVPENLGLDIGRAKIIEGPREGVIVMPITESAFVATLGDEVTDTVMGIDGIIVCLAWGLSGVIEYDVQTKSKEANPDKAPLSFISTSNTLRLKNVKPVQVETRATGFTDRPTRGLGSR